MYFTPNICPTHIVHKSKPHKVPSNTHIFKCLQTSDNTPFTPLCNPLTLSRPSPITNTPSISPLTSHPHPVPYKTQAGHSITALLGTCWATLHSWWLHYRSLQAATKTNMAVILWSNIHADWMQVSYVHCLFDQRVLANVWISVVLAWKTKQTIRNTSKWQ